MGKEQYKWDAIIKAGNKNQLFNFHFLYKYKDLLFLLLRRDFVTTYRQTILGPIWLFVNPIIGTAMNIFLFGYLAQLSTDGIPQVLFYLTGPAFWGYFHHCLSGTSNVFVVNQSLFSKVYFPKLIMVLNLIGNGLLGLGINFILIILVILYFIFFSEVQLIFTWYLFLLPFWLLLILLQGLGIGLWISAYTTKYRDISKIFNFILSLMYWVTPIVYPLSILLEKSPKMAFIISLNPMTVIMEGIRKSLFGVGTVTLEMLIYTITFTIVIVLLGLRNFSKTEKIFIDTI